jgi:DNA-binding transcriptional ArsR family regulator
MSKHEPDLTALFHALADPTRRAMLERLAGGAAAVGDLAAPFAIALPTALVHLRKLEAAGLVRSHKQGRVRTCELVPEALVPARAWIDAQRAEWEARLDRLDDYVTRLMEGRSDGHGNGTDDGP